MNNRPYKRQRQPSRLAGALAPLILVASLLELGTPHASAQPPDHYAAEKAQSYLAQGLAELESGELSAAQSSFNSAIQILKVNDGLFSTEQIAPVERLLWAHMQAGNWKELDTNIGYYTWLLARIEKSTLASQLAIAKGMRNLYLEASAHPENATPARYLSAALRTNWQALNFIEANVGANAPQLLPWLYDGLLLQFLESRLKDRRGLTNHTFKTDGSEFVSGWSLSQRESQRANYAIGVSLLDRIEAAEEATILDYAPHEQSPRRKRLAATLAVYRADWEAVNGNEEEASTFYNEAGSLLGWDVAPLTTQLPRPTFSLLPLSSSLATPMPGTAPAVGMERDNSRDAWAASYRDVPLSVVQALTRE